MTTAEPNGIIAGSEPFTRIIYKLRKEVTKNDGSVADADLDADLANITPTIGQNLAILSKINEICNLWRYCYFHHLYHHHIIIKFCTPDFS